MCSAYVIWFFTHFSTCWFQEGDSEGDFDPEDSADVDEDDDDIDDEDDADLDNAVNANEINNIQEQVNKGTKRKLEDEDESNSKPAETN